MARSTAKGKKRVWLRYLIMILFGGGSGLGGWQYKDHPALHQAYTMLTGHEPTEEKLTVKSALREVAVALKRDDAYTKAGEFEVAIAGLEVDDSGFKKGQALDLQARLIKKGAGGRDSVAWDSKDLGENPVKAGSGPMKADWSDEPITVSWKPGEGFVLEVWDRKRLFGKKLMEWSGDGEKSFPLRSGSLALSPVDGEPSAAGSKGSRIVLETKPRSDGAGAADPVAARRDETIKIR